MRMKLWQVGVFAYGLVYVVLACAMIVQNVNQSYPVIYVMFSVVAQTLVVCGVVLFGLDAGSDFAKVWRWLFPLLLLELGAGIVFDAVIPPEPQGVAWILSLLFSLWLVTPAYYFNFRIARYTS
jgi:hypothetical protein